MARCAGGFQLEDTMTWPDDHYYAHPYFLMGVKHEHDRILQMLKDNPDFNNIQNVIDYLENGQ